MLITLIERPLVCLRILKMQVWAERYLFRIGIFSALWNFKEFGIRAQILIHSIGAEKSTFWEELSFQRSESTAGHTVATTFCAAYKECFVKTVQKTLKLDQMIYICILYWKFPQAYLETLHSHFQPNCHFKMFKNSGSDCILEIPPPPLPVRQDISWCHLAERNGKIHQKNKRKPKVKWKWKL